MCANSVISGTSGRNTFQLVEIIEDDLKCYISLQNNDNSKFTKKQISDKIIVFICGYATCATYGTSVFFWPVV